MLYTLTEEEYQKLADAKKIAEAEANEKVKGVLETWQRSAAQKTGEFMKKHSPPDNPWGNPVVREAMKELQKYFNEIRP